MPRSKIWAYLVGTEGVEPSTSSLSEKRSTAELCAQIFTAGSSLSEKRGAQPKDGRTWWVGCSLTDELRARA